MRMQNTEMEFVAFDAQDVITTSGPDYTATKVKFTGETGKAYNDNYGGFDFGSTGGTYATLSKTFGYDISNMPAQDNGVWKAQASSTANAAFLDECEELTSYQQIVSWLKANNYTPHQ